MPKTAVFVTLRYGDYYTPAFLQQQKRLHGLRIVLVTDEASVDAIPIGAREAIDVLHVLPGTRSHGMQTVFSVEDLQRVIETERATFPGRDVRVVCCCEFNLMAVGEVRRRLRLPGPDDVELARFRDKLVMKDRVTRCGLRAPHFTSVKAEAIRDGKVNFDWLARRLGSPFVVKPIDAAGSVGVSVVASQEQLWACVARSMAYEVLEAEEFISGPLFHVDSVVQDGRALLHTVSEYTCPNLDFVGGRTLGSINLPAAAPQARQLAVFADAVLNALAPSSLSTHMEVFITGGEPVFLEVGGRPPGAAVCKAHLVGSGARYMNMDFQLQMGLPIDLPTEKERFAVWGYVPRRGGEVLRCEAPALECGHETQWRVRPGDRLQAANNLADWAGAVVASDSDYGKVRRDFERLREFEGLRMVDAMPCDPTASARETVAV